VPGGRNKADPLSPKERAVVYMLDPENGAPLEETEWSERREQKLLDLPPHLVINYHGISGKLTTPKDAQHVPLYGSDVAAWMYRSDTKEQKGAHLRGVHIYFPDGGERTFSIVKHRGGGPMLASQMAWMDGDTELYYGIGDVVGRADSSDNLNATGEFLVLGWLVGHACYNSPGDTRRWLRPEDRANPERGGKMRATALMIRILSIEHSGQTPLLTSPVTGTSYLGFQLELADKSLFGPGPGMFSYRCWWKTQFTQASLFDVAMNWWDSFTLAYTSSQINLQPSQDSKATIGEEHYASKHLWHMYKGIPSSALRLYSASAKWDAKRGATDSSSTHSQRAGKSINGKSNKRSNNAPPLYFGPKES